MVVSGKFIREMLCQHKLIYNRKHIYESCAMLLGNLCSHNFTLFIANYNEIGEINRIDCNYVHSENNIQFSAFF